MSVLNDSLHERDHRRVAAFVEKIAGIQLPDQKRNLVETRLRKRQRELGCGSLREYIDLALSPGAGEQIMLLDALTTNKTEFFREHSHYPVLANFLRHFAQSYPRERCKLWSAGCSTGEEPYTLAMMCEEHLGDQYRIDATDLSVSVLEIAQRATYPHASADPIPMDIRRRYLLRSRDPKRDLIRVVPSLREHVAFKRFNLISDDFSGLSQYQIIFCRNVMIYFSASDRDELIHRFVSKLVRGGLLFIGHSESLEAGRHGLRVIEPTVYEKI